MPTSSSGLISDSGGEGSAPSVPQADPRERALAHTLGLPNVMARVLLARGLDDVDRIRRHLRPELDQLADPFAFNHMRRAVERIRRAVANRERIVIHGDYDVDGIAGTVLLFKMLHLMGAEAKPYIPDRRDGYSFSEASRRAIAEGSYQLCISVDNGTNASETIARIQDAGCDVIVTDHHGTLDNVAPAHTVLNPRLPDAGYPDRELAGVGVAFCLARALAESLTRDQRVSPEFQTFLLDAMTYVALGTIADVAPLRGENRTVVFHGLRALAQSRDPGIRALLDSANLSDRSPDAEDVAFRIAPLLNAAGRMGQAQQAVELLLARGYQEAQAAAKVLEGHNENRRRVERQVVEEVLREARPMTDPILVLGQSHWHAGVLGIVASRVAEVLGKPTILISFDGDRGRGSGRSAGTLNLRDALAECGSCLLAHGGHAAAVGLELERARLDSFRQMINERAGARVARGGSYRIDGAADLAELDVRAMRRLNTLGPFGAGNPRPTFVVQGVKRVGWPQVDGRGQDLRFKVTQHGTLLAARWRNEAARFEELRGFDGPWTMVFSPRLSQWAEDGPVELIVHDLRPS